MMGMMPWRSGVDATTAVSLAGASVFALQFDKAWYTRRYSRLDHSEPDDSS